MPINLDSLGTPWPIEWLQTIDSTSTEAARRAGSLPVSPAWIAARSQTAGRGRRGRSWQEVTGNLYATALFPVSANASSLPVLSFTASLAVRETLSKLSGGVVSASLKWPNDVRVEGAKLCGILLEAGGAIVERWVSIGIGINLARAPDLPDYKTTSLADLTGLIVSPEDALRVLDESLRGWLARHATFGASTVLDAWRSHAEGIGQPIRVSLGSDMITGRFEGLDDLGQLLLRQSDGTVLTVSTGDVELVREAGRDAAGN